MFKNNIRLQRRSRLQHHNTATLVHASATWNAMVATGSLITLPREEQLMQGPPPHSPSVQQQLQQHRPCLFRSASGGNSPDVNQVFKLS